MILSKLDVALVFGYGVMPIAIDTLVSRKRAGHVKRTQDDFLAGKALPWRAVGAAW